jgi:soluble lytic murein transglycosylase-like protein
MLVSFSEGVRCPGMIRAQARIEKIRRQLEQLGAEAMPGSFQGVLESTSAREDLKGAAPGEELAREWGRNANERLEALRPLIREAAERYGVEEGLVRAVIRMESGGNPGAVSDAGAMGLMQLMPSTAKGLGVEDPFDPVQNLDGGVRYLRQLLDRYNGDQTLALAAYHSGPSRVDRYGGVPPFPIVSRYVKTIQALVQRERGESEG